MATVEGAYGGLGEKMPHLFVRGCYWLALAIRGGQLLLGSRLPHLHHAYPENIGCHKKPPCLTVLFYVSCSPRNQAPADLTV